jgi:aminoglycoside phosphotransferase (APT) family kinase protein
MLTLAAVQEATGSDAVRAFVDEQVLPGSGLHVESISRRSVRLNPPDAYWAVYRIRLTGDKELRLVARAAFDAGSWHDYHDRVLAQYAGRKCDPLQDLGYPVVFEETQHAFWFYPFDPVMASLADAANPRRVLRFLRDNKQRVLEREAGIATVDVQQVRYVPEVSALLRFDVATDPVGASRSLYGKVMRADLALKNERIMTELWRVSQASNGRLAVPRPLGFYPKLQLHLQSAAVGEQVSGDRLGAGFLEGALAAADALAVIHDSGIEADLELSLEAELARLDPVVEQFTLVHPNGHRLLRQLLEHIRNQAARTEEEERLSTHGDLKYDQLIRGDDGYRLVDFEEFGVGETSWDLAKFCAHAIPSAPQSWEESSAAEEARSAFVARYLENRPEATVGRFPVYEATHLANRAMVLMWSQSGSWRDAADNLMILAMDRLKESPPAPS